MKALLHALEDQPAGRPKATTDPEKDHLKSRVEELERQVQLYEKRDNLRELLKHTEKDSTKKNSK